MALDTRRANNDAINATAEFVYHVGASLNAQFGGGEGSSATGRQIENAFRYNWGFNNKSRRSMTIISKDAFLLDDEDWDAMIKAELDAGRPVLYMAQQAGADAGHAFVIDGYRNSDGKVHVNFGWGGHGNGYLDANSLTDPSGRSWNREPMIYLGLEPSLGFAALMTKTPAVPDYNWHGTGSIISFASGTTTGYGLTRDEAMIHPGVASPVVVFQWEIDRRDGTRLEIDTDSRETRTATISYGSWGDRSQDRSYKEVTLPFVLDPARDGLSTADQSYYVIALRFERAPSSSTTVSAVATTKEASRASSVAAKPFTIDGHGWNGNASVISFSSGIRTGYGLDKDETAIHPGATRPAVFFQWELDGRDGRKLEIAAPGMARATIRYGVWNDRSRDIVKKSVTLPYPIDPAADGLATTDGEYYVIEVLFDNAPGTTLSVTATTRK